MMKNLFLFLAFSFLTYRSIAQTKLVDYQTKTADNTIERTAILDLIRNDLVKNKYPEFIFVVKHLKRKDDFAFFVGEATPKNGKQYTPKEDEDCCHVEYLLKKTSNGWSVVAGAAFSTDAWWVCLWKEFKTPKEIFNFTEECKE